MSTFQIQSEIYAETELFSTKNADNDNTISKFQFEYPDDDGEGGELKTDSDGDLVVARKVRDFIEIEHLKSTNLQLVGLQVWRGALLLADYIITNRKMFQNIDLLELGAGVGLSSLVAAMYGKNVVCTDIDLGGILDLIRRNVRRNSRFHTNNVHVMELNFKDEVWSDELNAGLKNVEYIFAADLIYDDDLTELFVLALERLLLSLTKLKTIFIALEQRFVFTVVDLETTAPCYDYFLKCFQGLQKRHPGKKWRLQPIPLNFPQFFQYERCRELVLLALTNH